jgi:hypothetical protein
MADDKKPTTSKQKPIAERKEPAKSKKEDKKVEKDTKKEVVSTNKHLNKLINATDGASKRAQVKADSLVKMQDAQLKIDELRATGEYKSAEKMQKALNASVKLLSKNNTGKELDSRLKELTAIESQSSDLLKLQTTWNDQESKNNLEGVKGIISKLEESKKVLDDDTLNKDLQRSLTKLGGAFGRNLKGEVKELQDSYNKANEDLKSAIEDGDDRGIELANAQLAEIAKGAESEESRREAQKLNEEANSRLFQIASGLEEMGDKFDETVSAGAKGAGLLAGLTGLALMFLDPEKFQAIMVDIIEKASIVFNTISALLRGDFEEAGSLFSENMGTFGLLVGSLALLFGGKLIKLIGTALKAARVFRVFMMGTFIPTMIAAFSSMMAAITPIVVAMAPILLPILAIMALIGGLYFGFKKLQDSLGPGASIMDTLKVAMLYFVDFLASIVNGITYIPRKMISFLGKRAAKWLFGDDFDTSALDAISKGLDTGRGKRAADEIRAKNEAAAAEKGPDTGQTDADMEKMLSGEMPDISSQVDPKTTVDGSEILAKSQSNEAQKSAGQSVSAVITNATGGNVTNATSIRSTVVQSPITRATSVLGSVTSR